MKSTEHAGHFKRTFLLAFPVSLGQLGHMLTNIADSVMLGQYNPTHLAAAAFAFNVFLPFLVFSSGFSMGVTPLVANAEGADQPHRIRHYFWHSTVLYALIGILLSAVMFFGSPLLQLMGQSAQVELIAGPYFELISISLFPLMLFMVGKQFTEGLSMTFPAMIISIIGNLINILLNYIFIFGAGSLTPMGILGAGYATLIARILMALMMIGFLLAHHKTKHYVAITRLSKRIMQALQRMSWPISIQLTLEVSAFAISTIMVGWLGEELLVVHQIAISLASLTFIIVSGVGSAATIRVGYFLGRLDPHNLKAAARMALKMVLLFQVSGALVFIFARNYLPVLFVSPSETFIIETTAGLLIITAVFQIPDGLQVACLGILRGLNDVRIPTYITIVAYWVVSLPVGYIAAFWLDFGLQGIWMGFVCGLSTSGFLLFYRYKKVTNKQLR